jgi:hypothetical protein
MDKSSLKVVETSRFKKESLQLLESDRDIIIGGLVWALIRSPHFGQQVRGSEQRAWVLYRGGFAYLAYYSISGDTIVLESIVRRNTHCSWSPWTRALALDPSGARRGRSRSCHAGIPLDLVWVLL